MAIEIDFGRELGRLAFPDDITDEQAQSYVRENYQAIRQGLLSQRQEELAAETESQEAAKYRAGDYGTLETIGGVVSELPKAITEGFGGAMKGAERAIAFFPPPNVNPYTGRPIQQTVEPSGPGALSKAGQSVQEFGRETFPSLPGVQESIPAQIAGGVGSTLSVLPGALLAGPVGAGALYGLSAGEAGAEDARRVINRRIAERLAAGDSQGAEDLQAQASQLESQSFLLNAAIGGVSEGVLGVAGKIRFGKSNIGGVGARLAERLIPKAASLRTQNMIRGGVEGVVTEGLQESLEQSMGNMAAKVAYEPERGIMDGVAQAGFIGAATGGLVGGAIGSKRNPNLARANAIAEATGADPANPLPRSTATVAGLEDGPQPTGPIDIEPEITPEDVLRMSQEAGIPMPAEEVAPAPAPVAAPAPEPQAVVTPVVTPTPAPTPAAAPAATVDSETGLAPDEQDELDQLLTAEDAGLLSEEGAITLAGYRARLGGVEPAAIQTQPTISSAVQEQGPNEGVLRAEEQQPPIEVGLRQVDQRGRPAESSGAEVQVTPQEVRQVKARVAPAPVVEVTTSTKLPKNLAGAKPRYSISQDTYLPRFDSDFDLAAYIVTQTKKSDSDADYLKWAVERSGMTPEEVRKHGLQVRAELKKLAAKTKAGTAQKPAALVVPSVTITMPEVKVTATPVSVPVAAPVTPAPTPVAPTPTPAPEYTPARINSLLRKLKAKATAVGKGLYEIKKLAPGQRLVLRTRFGGLQETDQFLLQEKSQVTGYPSDEGFILRDKQEAVAGETPRPAPKPAPIGPKPDDELTEQQYYDARVKEIARDNKATQAEVREQFSREDSNLEHWQAIRNAAESGKQLKVETLNRLPEARIEFLRKQYPQSVPQGYMAPAVSKSVAEKQAEMRAAKRGVRIAPAPAISEEAELNELRITKQKRGRLGRLNEERLQELEKKLAPTPAEPVVAEPTEAELQAAEEARLAQAEQDIDAGPIGQAKQKLEDEGSDMKKSQVKAMARKLEKAGIIDDSELDDEGRDTEVDELVGQLLERVEEARDTAIQEREQELADEAKVEKVAPKAAPISKVAQIISKLENLKIDTGGTFDAVLGIPALIWNGALITAQNALRAGKAVTQAIDAAIEYIRTNLNEKQAARVNLDAVREQFETDLVLGRSVSEIIDDGKLRGYKQKARHLIPEERRKLRSDTKKRFVDLFDQLPSVSEFAAAALGGAVKRGWYRKSAEALIDVFGVDAPRFAALLAGLSPQTSVENNLINALNVWKNWNLAGRPTDRAAIVSVMGRSVQGNKGEQSVLDAWINNSVRALSSEDPTSITLSGPKVNSFMLNLRGVVNEVTNDAWMANFALVDQAMFAGSLNATGTDPGKGTGYLAMSAKVRATAEYLTELTGDQWTPAEVQETVWSWAKTLYELQDRRGETRNAVEILRAGDLTEEAIAGTPDFATLLADGEYRRILAEAGYGNQVEQIARRSAELRGAQRAGPASQAAATASQTLRNAEERAARRLVQLRKQRAAEAEAERNQRPDRVEAVLKKVIAATDPKGKVFEAITGLSNFVVYQASKIALRIYQATKSWVAARNAGMDYIKSHVQLSNEAETAANFEEYIKAFPNQEIPAGAPGQPQPPSPTERVESRGIFRGEVARDTDDNWQAEARKWVDFYKGNLERAFQGFMGADIDKALREYVGGELLQRSELEVARAKNPIDLLRALNLQARIANALVQAGSDFGKQGRARQLTFARYAWMVPQLVYRRLVNERQKQKIPFPEIVAQQVRKWLVESGQQAIDQVKEAMKQADNVFAREFKKIKQVPGQPKGPPIEIKWRDILTKSLETQGSVRQKMLQVILADPKLRNLSPAGIAEITNLLTNAWEKKRDQIFRSEFSKKVPLPTVKPDAREKLFRSLPRILKYANIARATAGDQITTDGPDTFLLWDQAFRDAVAPEFGVAEINGLTARKLTELAQRAQAAQGVNRNQIIQEMFRLMAQDGGVRFSDVLRDYWYAAVLSGTRTQLDNALNILNGALNTVMLAGMAGKEAGLVTKSALKGLNEGLRDFWPMLWRGELYRSVNFNPDQPGNALEGLGESRNLFAKGISQAKYVSRLMLALDHVTAMMSDGAAKAYALNKEVGSEEARNLMLPEADIVKAARDRAIAEGTRPDLVNKRTREILQESFPVDVLMTSKDIREAVTFTEVPQGVMGSLYEGLNAASRKFPALKFLTGTNFVRFAANYTNELLNYAAPIAVYRWVQSAPGKSDQPGGLQFTPARRDLLLAKASLGTALGATAAALFLGDDDKEEDRDIDITGSFKSLDPNKRKQLLSEGRQPYSIRVGDTYVSYRQLGFGGLLGAIGELRDRQLFEPEKWNEEGIIAKVQDAATAGLFIVKDSSAISGLTEFLGFANAYKYDTNEVIEKSMPRYLARLGGSFVPNILKEVDAWSDPSIFKAEPGGLGHEYFLQQVPYARRDIGPGPILNVLGEPVRVERYPYSRWITQRSEDPAWNTLGQLASKGVFMPVPAITVKVNENGTRRELTREEKYAYQQAVGQGYRKFIEQNRERLLALPPAQASDFIDKNADRIRRNARTNLKNSF
jgi:hypothetical protein